MPSQTTRCAIIAHDEWEERLRINSTHSSLMFLPAIVATTAAGAQRSGSALPGFIPAVVFPAEALAMAQAIWLFDWVIGN